MRPKLRELKSRKAALARIPFLADLILDRQAGRCGGAALGVFLVRHLRLVDVLDEVGDGGLLAHVPPLRAFPRFCHFRSSRTVAYVDLRRLSGGSPPAALWPYQFRFAAHALGPDRVPPCLVLLHIKVNQAILNLRGQSARFGCQHANPPRIAQAVPTETSSGWWRDVALLRSEKQ